jgi:hypothetical protein
MLEIIENTDNLTDLTHLIEAAVLDYLGLEIIDLEDYTDDCIPDNYPRYQVDRGGRFFATISTCGERFHARIVHNLDGYASLYEAATCWVNPYILQQIERNVIENLTATRSTMPDYF